jgi:phage antirepressor YoqD-like protein
MNGDPRKREVAAAQAYFAVRTRQAEATPTRELSGPELMAKALIEASHTLEAREATIKELTPRAEAYDAFLSTTGDYSVNEASKVLSRDRSILIGEKRLRDWMQDHGWIYRDAAGKPRAYQTQIDRGRLVEKAQWHYHPTSGEKVLDCPQIRITPKGLDRLAQRVAAPVEMAA